MSASMPRPKKPGAPPANVKWLVAIIIGVLVVGSAVAIVAVRAAGLATAPGFFGARAGLLADINFSLEIVLLLGLTFGFMLARRGSISAHQYNQTAWVLFNIVLVEFIMATSFYKQVLPGIPAKLARPYYWLSSVHTMVGGLTVFSGVYILLRMNKLLPKPLRVSWWKNLMRATLTGYWLVGLLGVGTYYVWYTAPAESTGAPAVAQTGHTVVVPLANYEFVPRTLTVPLGTTVVFVNQDPSPHTVTWDDGSADSGSFDQGEQFSFTFNQAGSFSFFCAFHGGPGGADMAGTIIVEGAGGAAAVPTAVSVALAPTAAPTPENPPAIFFEPSAVAFGVFRDNGDALSNEFRFIGSNIPASADGTVYELWLKRGGGQDTLGKVGPDANGNVLFIFDDPQGRNLLNLFDGFFVSVEAANDADPAPSDKHLFDGSISSGALATLRTMLVNDPGLPNGEGLVAAQRFWAQETLRHAQLAKEAAQRGDLTAAKRHAEHVALLLEGKTGADYRDLDGDGVMRDPGNGSGVIPLAQASIQTARQAAAAPDANKNIIAHGSHVQIYSQNVIDFGTQLEALAVQMAGAPDIGAAQSLAGQMQPLADALLNGVDADGDGVIEAGPGEGGARDAYNHAQYMAAMGVAFGSENP